jgi:uridine kinase
LISETKLNWKVQRDHEERFHSIDSLKQSIEDRKPDFDAYIDAQKKEKADAQTKIDHEERGHSIDSQKNSVDAQKKKKADPEKKNAIDPQKNSVDPQKKKADVIIQVPRAHASPQFVRLVHRLILRPLQGQFRCNDLTP